MLDKQSIAKLLGRPLTSVEDSNFEQYIDTTIATLESLLYWNPLAMAGERVYKARPGYHTLWVDPFTDIYSVTVNGQAVTNYTPAFNGTYTNTFYNSLEFDYPLNGHKVTIDAAWGFATLPADLGALIAGLFTLQGQEDTSGIKSKSIEDFSVTYESDGSQNAYIKRHEAVITKYATPKGEVQHGGYNEPVYLF